MKKNKSIEINGTVYTPVNQYSDSEEQCLDCEHVKKISDDEWVCGVDSSCTWRNCPISIIHIDYF